MGNGGLDRSWVLRSWVLISTALALSLVSLTDVRAALKSEEIRFWNDSEESARFTVDHSAWDALLKMYVVENHPSGVNLFDFEAVTAADRSSLDGYLDYLQAMEPRQYPQLEQKAYWLNLFNAYVVQRVLKDTDIDSIKDLGNGLWKKKRLYISMKKISLNDIEHGILRPIHKDPRVHFSLVVGALGSASILTEAFTGANVDELLEQNTRDFLSHPRGISIQGDKLILSTIFEWYQSDFGGSLDGVMQFIEPYVSDVVAPALRSVDSVDYEFDWALNKPG